MRYAICGLFSAFICWFVLFLSYLPYELGYDCNRAIYPQAVDIPKEVIQACREVLKKASEK
jgi:hypothetical protein